MLQKKNWRIVSVINCDHCVADSKQVDMVGAKKNRKRKEEEAVAATCRESKSCE